MDAVSRDLTSWRVLTFALFIEHVLMQHLLLCAIKCKSECILSGPVVRILFYNLFAKTSALEQRVITHTVRSSTVQRKAWRGTWRRMVWMPSVTAIHVTADMGKCTGFSLNTCADTPDTQTWTITVLVTYPGNWQQQQAVQLHVSRGLTLEIAVTFLSLF